MAVALGDRFGRRTVFLVGITIFTLASIGAALSTDPTQLIVARTIQGFGGAGIMPLSLALLAGAGGTTTSAARDRHLGRHRRTGRRGGPAGRRPRRRLELAGDLLANVPVAIIALPLILLFLPNQFGAKVRADVVGLVLAAAGVFGIVFGIIRGNPAGWNSFQVLASLIGGAVPLTSSCSGNVAPLRRCCHSGCSGTAASRLRTWSASGSASGCSGPSSS